MSYIKVSDIKIGTIKNKNQPLHVLYFYLYTSQIVINLAKNVKNLN